jgi:hypothetical protein
MKRPESPWHAAHPVAFAACVFFLTLGFGTLYRDVAESFGRNVNPDTRYGLALTFAFMGYGMSVMARRGTGETGAFDEDSSPTDSKSR